MKKRFLSILMIFMLVLGLLPATVFAASGPTRIELGSGPLAYYLSFKTSHSENGFALPGTMVDLVVSPEIGDTNYAIQIFPEEYIDFIPFLATKTGTNAYEFELPEGEGAEVFLSFLLEALKLEDVVVPVVGKTPNTAFHLCDDAGNVDLYDDRDLTNKSLYWYETEAPVDASNIDDFYNDIREYRIDNEAIAFEAGKYYTAVLEIPSTGYMIKDGAEVTINEKPAFHGVVGDMLYVAYPFGQPKTAPTNEQLAGFYGYEAGTKLISTTGGFDAALEGGTSFTYSGYTWEPGDPLPDPSPLWGSDEDISMYQMFRGRAISGTLDLSHFDFADVSNMQAMFENCTSLKSVNFGKDKNISRIVDMSDMFKNCISLDYMDFSSFNQNSSGLDVLDDMSSMFKDCSKLRQVRLNTQGGFNTSAVRDMERMFEGCTKLVDIGDDIRTLHTDNVMEMGAMFKDCASLTSLNLDMWKFDDVVYMRNMFSGCTKLEKIVFPQDINTSQLDAMSRAFEGCSSLKALDLSGFDTSGVDQMIETFKDCTSLEHLNLGEFNLAAMTDFEGGATGLFENTGSNAKGFAGSEALIEKLNSNVTKINTSNLNFEVAMTRPVLTNLYRYEVISDGLSEGVGSYALHLTDDFATALENGTQFDASISGYPYIWEKGDPLPNPAIDGKFNGLPVVSMEGLFQDIKDGENSKYNLDLTEFDMQNVENATSMFENTNFERVDMTGWNTSSLKYMNQMFKNTEFSDIALENINTSKVVDMGSLFLDSTTMETIDISSMDTQNLEIAEAMFAGCTSLAAITGIEDMDVQNVEYFSGMFLECTSLESLDLTKWDTRNARNMSYMFQGCTGFTELDLSNFTTANVEDMTYMFDGCENLTKLDLSNFELGMFEPRHANAIRFVESDRYEPWKEHTKTRRMFRNAGKATDTGAVDEGGVPIFEPAVGYAKDQETAYIFNNDVQNMPEMWVYVAETAIDTTKLSFVPSPRKPSSSGGKASTTVTVPVNGDENQLQASAKVIGREATVVEPKQSELEALVSDDKKASGVEIDLTGLNREITSANIPTNTVETIVDLMEEKDRTGEALSVKLTNGTMTFDTEAAKALADQAEGDMLKLVLNDNGLAGLNTSQREAFDKMEVHGTIDAYIVSVKTGERISDFRGGVLTLSVPFDVPSGKDSSKFAVWYAADDGKKTRHTTRYEAGQKMLSWITGHLSDYVIVYEGDTAIENNFVDVAGSAYYYDPVLWAAGNGITSGTDATHFSPAMSCTRAQMVTFLWRATGSPEPKTVVSPFTDITNGEYYYKAVLWAAENGYTLGTSETEFSPDLTVTRAQTVTFLWRIAGKAAQTGTNPFVDVPSGQYFHDAVLWAADKKITEGTGADTFSPNSDCTRAQIVTFLYRYFN